MNNLLHPEVLTGGWTGHELVDSGNHRKLERFGKFLIERDEPKAWWRPSLPASGWNADAVCDHDGGWKLRSGMPREWIMRMGAISMSARISDGSRHLGVFPEQYPHWMWMAERLGSQGRPGSPKVLNLFGYTGIATLVAAACGAEVTHVDASRPAVAWARENQALSGLEQCPVRWMLDDASKFVRREIRRNRRYDAIIMDPPSFGRGPKGELWKVENDLPHLLDSCAGLLSDSPLFVMLTLYNLEASPVMAGNIVSQVFGGKGARVTCGELALAGKTRGIVLPLSIFARWEAQ